MSASAIDVERNSFLANAVNKVKESAITWAALILSALSVLIAAGALMFAGISMYVAYDASEEAKIAGIRATNAEAKLEAYVRERE